MVKAKQRASASASPQEAAVRAAYAALPQTLEALAPFTRHAATGVALHFGAGDALSAAQTAWVMATLKRCAPPHRAVPRAPRFV